MYTCEKQVSVEEMDLDALIKMEQDNENLRQKLIDLYPYPRRLYGISQVL
jgi:hypothetical protein